MNSKFSIVAGVFEIFFACICMFLSSVFLLIITSNLASPFYSVSFPEYSYQLVFAVYGVVVFIFGLMGGIFALKRKHLALALIGACFIMFWGILFGWLAVSIFEQYEAVGILGTTTVMFSILSLAFLLVSRTEFT